MAYTGTLPPKIPHDIGAHPLPGLPRQFASRPEDASEQAAIPYFFVLVFSFFLLARPQDFINSINVIPFAMIFGSAAIFSWALGVLNGQIEFRKSKELNLMLGLTVWFILGAPFSFWRSNAFSNLTGEWTKITMIFLVLTQTVTSIRRLRHLLWIMFFSGFMATIVSMVMGAGRIQSGDRFLGMSRGFFHGNYLGIATAVLLPYMVAILIHTRSIFKQLLLIACFASMIFMIVHTASRGNMISVVLSLILVWVFMLRDSMKGKLIGGCFALGIVLAVAVAPHTFWERVGTLWGSEASTASTAGDEAEDSTLQRRALLIRSIEVTVKRPLFGLGIGNFQYYSATSTGVAQEEKGTHNTYTQVSSETGIPALIMFLMLLTTGITRMRRVVRDCEGRPELVQEKALAHATVVSLLSFMIGGCFAHLAWEFYVYYLAAIGVSLQTIYTLRTGQSLELSDVGSGKPNGSGGDKKNGHGWRRLRNAVREAST